MGGAENSVTLHLGKNAASSDLVTFKFSDYVDLAKMAAPPTDFGHETLISNWGMGGNDVAGDCVFAGASHEIKLWCAEADVPVAISDGPRGTAIKNYANFTGYDPSQSDDQGDNPTDQGTDVASWLSHRRRVGFIDDVGHAHRIGAYVKLELGNLDQLRYASYYFDGVGIGINFPEQWMTSFQRGSRTWGRVSRPNYVGGHYISGVAWRLNMPVICTWGALVHLTPQAYEQVADEVYAYLTPEKLRNGKDANGIAYSELTADLKGLKGIR
jgi:hypothetical protein